MNRDCFKGGSPRFLMLMVFAVLFSGCSGTGEKKSPEEAKVLAPLEVPPDLIKPYSSENLSGSTSGQKVSASEAQKKECLCDDRPPKIGEAVLPKGKGVQRLRDGRHRWLLVSAEPEQIWPLAIQFLEMRGYRIDKNEPAVGLIETGWKNRFSDKGDKDAGFSWRERLRIRLEPGQQYSNTEVYLSQYASERVKVSSGAESEAEQWKLREPDGERAIEMLNRFAQYLVAENVEESVALTPMVSRMGTDDEGAVLIVEAGLEKVWRRTAIALDALGFIIEDRDLSDRTYRVYNELSRGKTEEELKHGKPESATVREEYWLKLNQDGEETVISVRSKTGQIDSSNVATHLLNLLRGQFQ